MKKPSRSQKQLIALSKGYKTAQFTEKLPSEATEEGKTIQCSFHLEESLHRRLKVYLAQNGLSFRTFVTDAITERLDDLQS